VDEALREQRHEILVDVVTSGAARRRMAHVLEEAVQL
jgi:hypothetical protein